MATLKVLRLSRCHLGCNRSGARYNSCAVVLLLASLLLKDLYRVRQQEPKVRAGESGCLCPQSSSQVLGHKTETNDVKRG